MVQVDVGESCQGAARVGRKQVGRNKKARNSTVTPLRQSTALLLTLPSSCLSVLSARIMTPLVGALVALKKRLLRVVGRCSYRPARKDRADPVSYPYANLHGLHYTRAPISSFNYYCPLLTCTSTQEHLLVNMVQVDVGERTC